ncbi:MAG: TlpA family protein disulfide reductase [Sediminibacterium sp.]|nr:TlpA family protein disulfide reductase [Sediminibacterium sp.]
MLNVGDKAPSLGISKWLKGDTIYKLQKGKVYVLEFWATWCKPCIASMPHLSSMAKKYKDKITFLAINVFEDNSISDNRVKSFVDSMGFNMDYSVAIQDSNFMETNWIHASGSSAIPTAFVINKQGEISWIGHPRDISFDSILRNVLNDKWDILKERNKREENRFLAMMDDSLRIELMQYSENINYPNDMGKPDSAIFVINEIIKSEPRLKYAPFIASHTFKALLKINQQKAYEYGKKVLETITYADPAYDVIIGQIDWYSTKLVLTHKIYRLGTIAYQMKLDKIAPEVFSEVAPKYYHRKASWHILANEIQQAINAEQAAINLLKTNSNYSTIELNHYMLLLAKYKKMLMP